MGCLGRWPDLTRTARAERLVRGWVFVLAQSEIAHYLLSVGLVKPRAVVDEGLAVVDASRRNCVFLVTTAAGPTFVVKQARPDTAATLAHEAAVLRVLATSDLAERVPAVAHHEPDAGRLVLRTPGGARDWNEHHASGRFSPGPARILGRTLAALHALPPDGVGALPSGTDRMWGLSLSEPPRALLLGLSAGALDLVARVQASRAFCEQLDMLRDAHVDDALVHGDLRWDNCLVVAGAGSRRRTRLLLVDWELAGRGAAGFDVGTVLAEYLRVWVGSIPIVDPTDPGRLLPWAKHPLWQMRPAVDALWATYCLARPGHPPLRRLIELTAVCLLQMALEQAQGLDTPSAHVMILLQLADNLLRSPEAAADRLLGLRE
jgi:Ser/Thr protein kinase RdoA (MazF antagonist)